LHDDVDRADWKIDSSPVQRLAAVGDSTQFDVHEDAIHVFRSGTMRA
jgi:hypothetical protein